MTATGTMAAGIGCRGGCSGEEIAGLVRALFDEAALDHASRASILIAAPERKRAEPGVTEAAATLGLALRFIPDADLAAAQDRTVTRSARVEAAVGIASVAEAAALAAVGPDSRLLVPRRSTSRATAALAISQTPEDRA